MSYRIQEGDVLKALYLLSPSGSNALLDYLQAKHGALDIGHFQSTLARLIDRGAVRAFQVAGITLWSLPGN